MHSKAVERCPGLLTPNVCERFRLPIQRSESIWRSWPKPWALQLRTVRLSRRSSTASAVASATIRLPSNHLILMSVALAQVSTYATRIGACFDDRLAEVWREVQTRGAT